MRQKWDFLLLFLICALGSLSILAIFSIDQGLALNQIIFWVIGLSILLLISNLHYQIWQKISLPFYLATLLLLILLIFFGEPVRGSVRWIDLGIFRIQPSEIAKVSTILFLSSFYLERSAGNFKNLFLSLLIIFLPFSLVFFQPDIGNALSFLVILIGVSLFSGLNLKHVVVASVFAVITAIIFSTFLAPYQKQRLESFLNPTIDPLGTGYNIIQAKIAVGSGQFFGQGLGQGSQSQLNFLPEAESDFIFASITEQLGFSGSALLIIIFAIVLTKLTKFVQKVDRFARLIVVGTISFLLYQFFVNVGMNMGIVPVTGITLPLVSYGGSSLISNLFLLGIIFSIIKNR